MKNPLFASLAECLVALNAFATAYEPANLTPADGPVDPALHGALTELILRLSQAAAFHGRAPAEPSAKDARKELRRLARRLRKQTVVTWELVPLPPAGPRGGGTIGVPQPPPRRALPDRARLSSIEIAAQYILFKQYRALGGTKHSVAFAEG